MATAVTQNAASVFTTSINCNNNSASSIRGNSQPNNSSNNNNNNNNAKNLKKQYRNEVIRQYVNSWLLPGEVPFTSESIAEYLQSIKHTLTASCCGDKRNAKACFLPTFIYAHRFVLARGAFKQEHILELLIVSAMISLKMHNDTGAKMDVLSFLSGLSKVELIDMERNFLASVEYKLVVDPLEIAVFNPSESM